MPVHDAAVDTYRCLVSIFRHAATSFRLVVVDDGSSDPDVVWMLRLLARLAPDTVLLAESRARGFVHAINKGIAASPHGDVVILNSDVVVTANWLEKLAAAAHHRPDVATVTPLTNNGTICSVPSINVDNGIPAGYDIDSFARLVETTSFRLYPETPTGVGFCMLITRRALEQAGTFDEETYGEGYGEENDFCQRALAKGLVNVIADDTFVFHRGHASFGERASRLMAAHVAVVQARHPTYNADISRFMQCDPLRDFRSFLRQAARAGREARVPTARRVLHVLHAGGGTERHARDLAATRDETLVSYVACSSGTDIRVDEYFCGHVCRSLNFPFQEPVPLGDPREHAAYRDALSALCATLSPDVIHVHHLIGHSVDLARVARDFGICYIVTLHDYFTICPSYTLLKPDGDPCGACLTFNAPATTCATERATQATVLKEHQARMSVFLSGARYRLVPNVRARDILAACYPGMEFRVIEHGTRAPGPSTKRARPQVRLRSEPLNVAVIGAMEPHKGVGVLRQLLRDNRQRNVRFHLYGTSSDPELVRPLGVLTTIDSSAYIYHGPYLASEIVERLRADRIHVGLHLSLWAETFGYTLSEFAEAGVPVIAGECGAQGERVERCRLGWTVENVRDTSSILTLLGRLAEDPDLLARAAEQMRLDEALLTLESMWQSHERIYTSLDSGEASMTASKDASDGTARYVAYMATQAAQIREEHDVLLRRLRDGEAELTILRETLRSPRHRVANALAEALHRLPLVWPLVSSLTEWVLRREAADDGARVNIPVSTHTPQGSLTPPDSRPVQQGRR